MKAVLWLAIWLLIAKSAASAAPVNGAATHVYTYKPASGSSILRRLLAGALSELGGPNSFLTQTKTASDLTTKDLREASAHAYDFEAGRAGKRDRRLLDGGLSGLGGPNSFLAQAKTASDLTTQDLRATSARANDFESRRSDKRDRRLLGGAP